MTSETEFETRLAAALREPVSGDPPFPAERLASRLAESVRRPAAVCRPRPVPVIFAHPRPAAAAAAALALFGCGAAVGAWAAGWRPPAQIRPAGPEKVVLSSIVLYRAPLDEALAAIAAETAREQPEPENRLRFRLDLPEGAAVPTVTLSARGVDATTLLLNVASAAGLDVDAEEDGTWVLSPEKPRSFEPEPGERVWWNNEWNRDPATRPPVLHERSWTLPAAPPSGAEPFPATSAGWRERLAAGGVDWVCGTELAFNAPFGLLRVSHAPEVLDRIDAVLRGLGATVSDPAAEEESDAP